MNFILLMPTGKILTFYIRECAVCYQTAYGGTLIDSSLEEAVGCEESYNLTRA